MDFFCTCVCILRCFCAALLPLSFLSRLIIWIGPRKGYKKLHLSGERDVLLFRDVEIYMMLLDISEILNIL
jgi:hypothetical protein